MVEHVDAHSMSSFMVSQSSSNGSKQAQAIVKRSDMHDSETSTSGLKVSSNSRQPMVRIEREINGQTQVMYVPRDKLEAIIKARSSKKSKNAKTTKKSKTAKKTKSLKRAKRSTHSKNVKYVKRVKKVKCSSK